MVDIIYNYKRAPGSNRYTSFKLFRYNGWLAAAPFLKKVVTSVLPALNPARAILPSLGIEWNPNRLNINAWISRRISATEAAFINTPNSTPTLFKGNTRTAFLVANSNLATYSLSVNSYLPEVSIFIRLR